MSNPQPSKITPKPKRAEPLQPDAPGSGDQQVDDAAAHERAEDSKDRADTAQKNVSEGYD